MISSKEDNATLLMVNRHSSIHKVTRIFTYVQKFISSTKRRSQSSRAKQRTKRMLKRIKACSSTPNEKTDSNESMSQLKIQTQIGPIILIQSPYKGKIYTEVDFNCTASHSKTFFTSTRSSRISPMKRQATTAETRHSKTFSNITNPLDQRGLVVKVGPGSPVLTSTTGLARVRGSH